MSEQPTLFDHNYDPEDPVEEFEPLPFEDEGVEDYDEGVPA